MTTAASPVSQPQRGLAILNILAFATMIGANVLSIFLPLNGKTQMQLSAQYENMFTPAGFTFSVWSIIYIFLFGFVVFGTIVLFKKQHPAKDKVIAISPLFIGVCLCNAGWLFAWHYEYVLLSVCIIFLYLILLISIHQTLDLALPWKPLQQKLWLDIPFSLNLGWICVAAIANVTAWCVQHYWGYSIFAEATWAIIMIAVGAALALLYVLRNNNIFVGLVIMWALYGVASKRGMAGDDGANGIISAAWIAIGLIFATILLQVLKGKKTSSKPQLISQP